MKGESLICMSGYLTNPSASKVRYIRNRVSVSQPRDTLCCPWKPSRTVTGMVINTRQSFLRGPHCLQRSSIPQTPSHPLVPKSSTVVYHAIKDESLICTSGYLTNPSASKVRYIRNRVSFSQLIDVLWDMLWMPTDWWGVLPKIFTTHLRLILLSTFFLLIFWRTCLIGT